MPRGLLSPRPRALSLHCVMMTPLRPRHRARPRQDRLLPSVFQLRTFKSPGYYKTLCQGNFGFHVIFTSEKNDISVNKGLRRLRYSVIKMLSNTDRMYKPHQEWSPRMGCVLITALHLGGCFRFIFKECSAVHSSTSPHVLIKLLKLANTTKKRKERIKKEVSNTK